MKLHVITCQALQRECYHAAAHSPHIVTLTVMPFGLHNTPDDLRAHLQSEIDRASGGQYDAILLGYGLCSRGTAELTARDTPVVIPRAHDCITMFLGSRQAYDQEFGAHPGTYYYSPGWIELKEGAMEQGSSIVVQDKLAEARYQEYVEKYGEDNAQFLIEQENQWYTHYNRAAFIDMGMGDIDYYRTFTQQIAESKGWEYAEIKGNARLVDLLMCANWPESEFLIVKPGQRTYEDVNAGIISAG